MTKRQNVKMKKRQHDKKTKKDKKIKGHGPKREINIVTSGQFRTLAMFLKKYRAYDTLKYNVEVHCT